jgi:hypothetical protein
MKVTSCAGPDCRHSREKALLRRSFFVHHRTEAAAAPVEVVPYADSAPLSAKLVQNGTLKTFEGFPYGMPTTQADTINADLLAFLQS